MVRLTKKDDARATSMLELFSEPEEVAATLGCTMEQLEDLVSRLHGVTVAEYAGECAARGRARLRRAQFEAAMEGDRSMLLALGKQYPGQDFDAKRHTVQGR